MFIQTEATPNPQSLKFIPGRNVIEGSETFFFEKKDLESVKKSPLAKRLLEIEGIEAVFLASNFITITKLPESDWYILKPMIIGVVVETFVNNWPILISDLPTKTTLGDSPSDHEVLIYQIQELLDTRIRPAVAQDGGDIVFDSFEDGVVYLRLRGACSGCPSSIATLKSGVENLLKYYVPEVREVRQIDD